MKHFQWALMALTLAFVSSSELRADDDVLSGAWLLDAYVLDGNTIPSTGIMIFAEGHFAMVYAMDHQGRSGRGHGGTYRTDGDEVTFAIPWWVQHVAGEPQVMKEEIEAKGRFEQEGDGLVIRFASGSEQRFTRAPGDSSVSESWLMTDYESRAKTGPTSGMMLLSGDHFALLYTMRPADASPDGRAHAGRYEKDGSSMDLMVEWSMQVIAGEGSVDEGSATRSTTVEASEQTMTLNLGGGAVQTFSRAN